MAIAGSFAPVPVGGSTVDAPRNADDDLAEAPRTLDAYEKSVTTVSRVLPERHADIKCRHHLQKEQRCKGTLIQYADTEYRCRRGNRHNEIDYDRHHHRQR
jgi:hypothetical protein